LSKYPEVCYRQWDRGGLTDQKDLYRTVMDWMLIAKAWPTLAG